MEKYIRWLIATLTSAYTPPGVTTGHDINHVNEMLALGSLIRLLQKYRDVDSAEFVVVVWLHNTDRPYELKKYLRVGEEGWRGRWASYLLGLLSSSPFTDDAKDRIVDAVLQHSKKDDEEGDSALLTALRIADKVVRLGPLGMLGQPAGSVRGYMFYNGDKPFSIESTKEKDLNAVLNDFFRVLEWIPMLLERALTIEELYALVPREDLDIQIAFLRALGRRIAHLRGVENDIERLIQRSLGKWYSVFA